MAITLRILLCIAFVAGPWAGPARAQSESSPGDEITNNLPPSGASRITIRSRILDRERPVLLAFPASYSATRRDYPVIVVLDGEASFDQAVYISRTLARLGHVPEAIVAAIPNLSSDPYERVHDMTPSGMSLAGSSLNEGGDRFLDFIERELLPLLRSRHRASGLHIMVGHSSGAVIATYAAATRRSVFPVVVAIDAPMEHSSDWLAHRLISSAPGGKALRYVSLESRFGWPDRLWSELRSAAPATWRLYREHLHGESHETMPFLAMYQGLKLAFSDYSLVGAPLVPRASAMAAFDHYARIEQEFGTELPPPRPALRQMVVDLLTEGQVEPARRAMNWFVKAFGKGEEERELAAMVDRVASSPPLEESVASLQATPLATAAEIQPFIGEWRGQAQMGKQSYAMGLRIRVEGGKVFAEILNGAAGAERSLPIEFLKVLAHSLEFGRMNGMRPRGDVHIQGPTDGRGSGWKRSVPRHRDPPAGG